MKKIFISLFILCAFLYSLFQDGSYTQFATLSKDKVNTIQHVPIDDDEYHVMKSTGMSRYTFIYSIDLRDVSVSKMDYWIDRYSGSGKQETVFSSTKAALEPNKLYKLYLSAMDFGQDNEIWVLSMRNEGNIVSASATIPRGNKISSMSGTILKTSKITKDEPIDLAIIKRSSVGSISISFGEDVETNLKEHEEVFVLRCRFY